MGKGRVGKSWHLKTTLMGRYGGVDGWMKGGKRVDWDGENGKINRRKEDVDFDVEGEGDRNCGVEGTRGWTLM